MKNLATILTFSVISTFSYADEEVKALLPVFGEPLKADSVREIRPMY